MKQSICLLYLIFANLFMVPHATSANYDEKTTIINKLQYPIRDEIIALVSLSTKSMAKANNALQVVMQNEQAFNVAEQYLLLLSRANIAQKKQQHQQVIVLLTQAQSFKKTIAAQQLNLPLFSNMHLVLAESLAKTEQYEKAYNEKKAYVDEFNDYSDDKRENTVNQLTLKYKLSGKNKENALLNNQNKLKALQLSAVTKQQEQQQQYLLLIVTTLLIFILLFVRQLKVRKKLLLLAKTDSLTGLLNRSALFYQGQKMVVNTVKQQQDFSVLFFDIDYFKQINDLYGHQIGDAILIKIANLSAETMRFRDVLARFGGEEFVALLPNTDIDKAKAIATRVLDKIAHHDFNYLLNEENIKLNRAITISIGVANIRDTSAVFEDVLHAAGLAMYQAKAQGRNQMISYNSIAKEQERRQR